jgi:hypothetical protein
MNLEEQLIRFLGTDNTNLNGYCFRTFFNYYIEQMIKIEFPKEKLKTQQREGIHEVFDAIRKKWVVLTPEEWVRQNIIQFLLKKKQYPASLIAIEKEIKLGELKKRCDIVVYNRQSKPWMIIECKEMNVMLSEKTLEQILRYHISLPAQYLIITNGSYCYGFKKEKDQFFQTDLFPDYE